MQGPSFLNRIHSTNTPRPLLQAPLCTEAWDQNRAPVLQGFQVSLEQAQTRYISNSTGIKRPSFTGSHVLYPSYRCTLDVHMNLSSLNQLVIPFPNDPLARPPSTFLSPETAPAHTKALALGHLHNSSRLPQVQVLTCALYLFFSGTPPPLLVSPFCLTQMILKSLPKYASQRCLI